MGLVGTAIGAAGSIFGGISASTAIKKMNRNIEAQRQQHQAWYDQRYNEDATQRADAQRVRTQTQEMLKRQTDAAAGSAAVGGGADESVAQAKAAANQTLGNVMNNINAAAEQRKDEIEQTYQANDNAFQEQLNNLEQKKADNISQAVQGVANAAGKMDFGGMKLGGLPL